MNPPIKRRDSRAEKRREKRKGKRSKREKKRGTLAKRKVIRSRRTWKLQLCMGMSEDREGGQYQKNKFRFEVSKLKRYILSNLKGDMRPVRLIFGVQCKVLNILTCCWLVLHILLYVCFDFMNAKLAAKRMLIFCW